MGDLYKEDDNIDAISSHYARKDVEDAVKYFRYLWKSILY